MNKKLPSIYKASDCSHIKNNKTVFCSSDVNFDFTNDDRVTSDVSEIDYVFNTPKDPLRSVECVAQRCDMIEKNLAFLAQQK